MKIFLFTVSLMAGLMLMTSGGCAPSYTPGERGALISRNWEYEFEMSQDDVDHVFLLRPSSRLTGWNVR